MKLQRQFIREVEGKKYYRWVVQVPPEIVAQLGWDAQEKLDVEPAGDVLIIRRAPGER